MLDAIPPGNSVADIGSDHGWIAAALSARGHRVVATERTPRTVDRLRADAANSGWGFEVRQGEGMQPVEAGEVDTVVVAGLGGRSMVRILRKAAWLPARLVLQPMSHVDEVVDWLEAHDWQRTTVRIADRGRCYEIFSATQ